jgi:hypothetical protein
MARLSAPAPRFDCADAGGNETRHWLEPEPLGRPPLGHDHGGGAGVQAGRVAGGDRAILAEGVLNRPGFAEG